MNDKANLLTDKVNVTIHKLSLQEKKISYACGGFPRRDTFLA